VSLSQTAPPGIPDDLSGVTLALPSTGLLFGGPYFPITSETILEYTKVNLEDMERSTSGASDKGSCTKAPQIGATVWEPVEQGADETLLIEGGGGGEMPISL